MSTSSAQQETPRERSGRAIVIGGSMAGSLAAAALSRHFAEVTVLDRDAFPEKPDHRKGVPHGHHFHALLAGGREAIDSLLPDFSRRAVEDGAHTLSVTADVRYRQRCGWMPRFPGALEVVMASRPFIEWTVRELAGQIDGIHYRPRTSVLGLRLADGRVTGVSVKDEQSGAESDLDADLVVDASGRNSKASSWLRELGYPSPSETTVNAHWGYSSVFVRVPKGWDPGFRAMYTPPLGEGAPEGGARTRGCAMWVQEGEDRWIFTVQGAAGDYPPRDEAGLRAYVATIGVAEVDAAVAEFEFISPVQVWRDTTNRLRDYANLAMRPENFVLLGDSVAAFNPVYGQGMTMAAISAVTLDRELQNVPSTRPDALAGLAERFQKSLDGSIQFCWSTSTGQDYRVPGVELMVDGQAQPSPAGEAEFSDRLLAFVSRDRETYEKFMETTQLIRSPEWLAGDEVVSAIQADWDELGKLVLR
ncbi:NAD(P)/FAD-dependent oxidoreductase [Pseudonocardia xishanensis]|uniref:FAD-binding domain-containing protein n=1 Tax=Pseudonocardia xishanensis TaxID=630995 RepID=A0ABP8RZ17_9PSEU